MIVLFQSFLPSFKSGLALCVCMSRLIKTKLENLSTTDYNDKANLFNDLFHVRKGQKIAFRFVF